MIAQRGIEDIVQYCSLSEEDRKDLLRYFERTGKNKIIRISDGVYYTYKLLMNNKEPRDIRVEYGPDMFYMAHNIIVEADYAIAVNGNGKAITVLEFKKSVYRHRYVYSGGIDMSFLGAYDCICLHECNEYSVELCQTALKLWKGKRLVLVGKSWEQMIPMLPDMPYECWYEELLTEEILTKLGNGMKKLHIMYGIPHAEPMDRYYQGIMYYEEIMAFTFMFSDYRQHGDENPDKHFLVIDGGYDSLGLFAIFAKVETCARYAKSKGFIPVIRLNMSGSSFYQNSPYDDVWSKFYEQPEGYSMKDISKSKNVYYTPTFYNGNVTDGIMNIICEGVSLSWNKGIYNSRIKLYVKERMERYLKEPEHTLGVLARGTDYVNTHLANHPIHASKEMIGDKIDEMLMADSSLRHIYMSTEDASYHEYFTNRYGDKISFTDQKRYITKKGQMLFDMHKEEQDKRDGFLLGAEYIASISLLSRCRKLLASGGCGGVSEAIRENDGRYEEVYVFELGVNNS